MSAYTPRVIATHTDLVLRGLRHRIHCWGEASATPVFLLHGWMDTGMSFQFLADALAANWYLVAPDWRGFGDTQWDPNGYWFPDYLADLDVVLAHFSPDTPARIVGHSMGGNVAFLYAGVRPERVSHVACLDVAGLPDAQPDAAPARYAHWLDQLRNPERFSAMNTESAAHALVRRLASRLDQARTGFMAQQWVRRTANGNWRLPHDPRHKHVNPVLYRRDEARACWRGVKAHTLLVLARDGQLYRDWEPAVREDLMDCIPQLRTAVLECGHMVHLEMPDELAGLLGSFLTA
ncbi:MAG: alpha/beta fold hydrolase [Gammaproteobacteria bacterium]|nr:alpha/beta fold hydrolase [Gammaproteobacteria bacterium]